uniref:SCP domain-containing protein n=1 Tax=Zooxanthella nutricula TaxID=1333877 RepID=A0A7S2M0V2_9DINO
MRSAPLCCCGLSGAWAHEARLANATRTPLLLSRRAGARGPAQARALLAGQPPHHLRDVLDIHNLFRCMHGVPSLRWHVGVEANAKHVLAEGRGEPSPYSRLQHVAGFDYVGENVQPRVTDAAGLRSAEGAVQLWYQQVDATARGKVDRFSYEWAKYAQIVWGSTTDLGCALEGGVLLCQYGPAGNVPGRFAEEVKPAVRQPWECGAKATASHGVHVR